MKYLASTSGTGWALRNFGEDNDLANRTLAYEDGQQVEADKMILAGEVLFNRLYHINIYNIVKNENWKLFVLGCLDAPFRIMDA